MHATKTVAENKKILHDLVPLNSLSPERFAELSEKIAIETVKAGRYLFRKGDRDNQTMFLLEGAVHLIDGFRKICGEIKAGTEESRHPISNLQPRQCAARAVTRSVIARIDSGLLDVFLTWDPSNTAEVVDIGVADNTDWMTRMLQSKAFVKLPPSMLQALLMRFKPVEVCKGQVVIEQGSEGDHFYTIHEGRCVVTRREGPDAPEQKLAELYSGDSFGEESLVSESRRNASVTMLTDGLLMCLAKQDFVDLLKTTLVKYVHYDEAVQMVEEGAVWVDVRTTDEYETGSFEDSVNIPLSALRGEMPELVYNAKYVIYCDTGSRSDSAAFVLSHRGFDVCVLKGGMASLPAVARGQAVEPDPATDATQSVTWSPEQVEALIAELEAERQARHRVDQQLEMVRGELAESNEKLAEFYTRSNALEEERQQFRTQTAAMRERHAEQLRAVTEQLEQEQRLSREMRKSISGLQAAGRDGLAPTGPAAAQAEVLYLRKTLQALCAEQPRVEEQLQQLAHALDAMRGSMRRITQGLPAVAGDATGWQAGDPLSGESRDLEE
ncbi:MAG: cyclic nucleotide-binding domain-containing protein [Gammaproteobacteria bacterium]|jgi:rhodanese-related sulfurtransferase/CRP-like cAMP-binding protein